ncbi:hypothetical protein [Luteococcus japonicus]|uniref:hypothetical protein n=1 Tax=Luteococcus japonicus TaxID=33984 RepID=UPI00117C1907|nr:hypothetical protein [Luteococcus japonicus]
MHHHLNPNQMDVLRWAVNSPSEPPPPGNWKASAVALQNRGLVTISRKGGQYRATPTEVGRYFCEHGTLPPVPAKVPASRRSKAPSRAAHASEPAQESASVESLPEPAAAALKPTPPEPEQASLEERLGPRPHPAVRSLWKHPGALPEDPEVRERAILAAHELVQAAKEAGLKIEGHTQPRKRSHAYGIYLGELLVTLDAGDSPVRVKIGEVMKRVPHELTAEEQAKKRRNEYFWAPTYDHVGTGVSCFRVYTDKPTGGGTRYAETKSRTLASFVPVIIQAVQRASEAKREREERQRRWQEQRRLEEIARQDLARNRAHYEKWEGSLSMQVDAWKRADEARAFLEALELQHDEPEVRAFVTWARENLAILDPSQTLALPGGDVPKLSHLERRNLGRPRPETWARW